MPSTSPFVRSSGSATYFLCPRVNTSHKLPHPQVFWSVERLHDRHSLPLSRDLMYDNVYSPLAWRKIQFLILRIVYIGKASETKTESTQIRGKDRYKSESHVVIT